MKYWLIILFACIVNIPCLGQKMVSFTIDDVPNALLYNKEGFQCRLLTQIDSMNLPVAIFINEQRIYMTDSLSANIQLLKKWIESSQVTVGNHAFSHAMYSVVGLDSFKTEILKGEAISRELANRYKKKLVYFRFPYNDLGIDAKQHKEVAEFLESKNYIITPFTVHSEDWMVTELYAYYRHHHMDAEAEKTGAAFVRKTLAYFDHIDSITRKMEGRDVRQIYLLHDNLLEADYLHVLVSALKERGYTFIRLDEAMQDPIYKRKDYFQQKPGISWVYRWMENDQLRNESINQGPNVLDFEREYDSLKKLTN